jgi:DNA-binding GntR family transcriptional regulator
MQKDIAPIDHGNVSHSVEAELRRLIIDGAFSEGDRLNEVHLSTQLGVSRTPVREALNRLAAEGALDARPRIGYSVKPLTEAEFTQLYDLRPILDPAALRMAGLPSSERLDALDRLNRKLEKTRDAEQAIELDDDWHLSLLADCPNRILVGFIESVMRRTRRYELTLMREGAGRSSSIRGHEEILAFLRKQDLEAACASLQANMQHGRSHILDWLRSRTLHKTARRAT